MSANVRESFVRELAFALHEATGGIKRSACTECERRAEDVMPAIATLVAEVIEQVCFDDDAGDCAARVAEVIKGE